MRAVNLIPAEQRSGASVGIGRSQGGAYAVVAVVGGLAVLAVLYGSADHQIASRRGQAAALSAQAQTATEQAERLAPYASFIAMREQRTQAVDTLVNSRFDWARVFHEFGRVLPAQTSISSLSGTIAQASASVTPSPTASTPSPTASTTASAASGGSVASSTPPGSVPTFTLSGCAASQQDVALTLERLRLINGVQEVTLQNSTAAGSASASGSTGGGACAATAPTFAATVTFDPLPSAAAVTSAAKTVSDSTSAATPAPTTSGESSK
jgi:Tfp pilus assembly protein PilN